jgi:hypothetical protein
LLWQIWKRKLVTAKHFVLIGEVRQEWSKGAKIYAYWSDFTSYFAMIQVIKATEENIDDMWIFI